MKTKLSFIICLLGLLAHSQNINIPDTSLKTILSLSNTTTYLYAKNLSGQWMKVDTSGDGEIQASEAALVKEVYLQNLNFSTPGNFVTQSLIGLESFPNMDSLYCNNNPFSSNMDFSSLIQLKYLGVDSCNINSINVTGLNLLENFICGSNNLSSIDISGLPNLKSFYCPLNQIALLDLSNNPLLTTVGCDYNLLTSINLINNPMFTSLYCSGNQIHSLDFSNNPMLKRLICKNNNLNYLNIKNGINQDFSIAGLNDCWKTGNPNLTTVCADASEQVAVQNYLNGCGDATQIVNVVSNCSMGNEEFGINEIKVFPNPTNSTININGNSSIKTIELYDIQGRVLVTKEVNANKTNLDISGYTNGVYFVKIFTDAGVKLEKVIKE